MWLQRVKAAYGEKLQIEWHDFALEQINSVNGPDWKLWEQPDEYKSRGLWALRAGRAAKLQGRDAFERFHIALLKARHEQKADLSDIEVLARVARETGLDEPKFRKDIANRDLLAQIGDDYTLGAQQHGVWGTPTLVFDGQKAAYLKMRPAAPAEDSVKVFEELYAVINNRPYIQEVKRPR